MRWNTWSMKKCWSDYRATKNKWDGRKNKDWRATREEDRDDDEITLITVESDRGWRDPADAPRNSDKKWADKWADGNGWSWKSRFDREDNDGCGWKPARKKWRKDDEKDRKCGRRDDDDDDFGCFKFKTTCDSEPPQAVENRAPEFTSPAPSLLATSNGIQGAEIGRVTAEDLDGDTLVFSIRDANGPESADGDMFLIDAATGTLTWREAVKADGSVDGDSTYEVEIMVSDGELTDTIELDVIYITGA